MILNASGARVKTVTVDSRTVVEDGVVPGPDIEAMRYRAQANFERYRAACSEWGYLRRPADVLFPSSFRPIQR
jgi:8-oxoguanine deaminase